MVRFVTGNEYKFNEAERMMKNYEIKLLWTPLPMEEVQSDFLEEILITKVLSVIKIVKPPFIVEDSGLYIDALNGFPGPFAAYAYKKLGLDNILRLMRGREDRNATFIALGALVFNKQLFKIFRGVLAGEIGYKKIGKHGFGYDPIFIPENREVTLAQLSTNEKNMISHRGRLFKKIAEYIIRNI